MAFFLIFSIRHQCELHLNRESGWTSIVYKLMKWVNFDSVAINGVDKAFCNLTCFCLCFMIIKWLTNSLSHWGVYSLWNVTTIIPGFMVCVAVWLFFENFNQINSVWEIRERHKYIFGHFLVIFNGINSYHTTS